MAQKLTIHVFSPTRTVAEFEKLALQAKPLKRHGRVEMTVSNLAEQTLADMPTGRGDWHEYAAMLPTFQKFFPHKKMQPFVDMKHVAKNRALLRGSVKVVRKHGYAAGFTSQTPFFMREEFFVKYPHLRGARCDHPRRSRQAAFAPCVDHEESQQMYAEMAAEVGREVPDLSHMRLVSNDSGAGLCWSEFLYPGPNGPSHCRHISTAARVKSLMDVIQKGMGANKELEFQLAASLTARDCQELLAMVGDSFDFVAYKFKPAVHEIDVLGMNDNPVRGIIDAVSILKGLDAVRDPAIKRVFLNFGFNYHRGSQLEDVTGMVIELAEAFLAERAFGTVNRFHFLRKMCHKWVGEKKADDLLEALVKLNEAYALKREGAGAMSGNYCGVSMRLVNRPLVILPELLTAEEEAYFLPHVFNPNVNEARMDYLDWHGGKLTGGRIWEMEVNSNPRLATLDRFCGTLQEVARTLDDMGGTPSGETFQRMGISLRLYACVFRSINNFFAAGTVRDRNVAKLTGPAHIPPKVGDWVGDPDLQLLNSYMRDELDNAVEMTGLLENGGMRQMLVAERAEDEDTFLLGPDLIGDLRKKCAIMQRHWMDAQQYMSTPHK